MADGVIVIDKPKGLTSHDVVARLRRILKTRKIGHTGTLDPFATGVLVMLVGRATRLARFLGDSEKEYEAVMRFGFETDTGDATGEPKGEPVAADALAKLDSEKIESVLPRFRGEIEQIPPMYSAKKVDGERLYKLAREGKEIERQPVRIRVTDVRCTGEIGYEGETREFGLSVTCSAGTYVRTLAEDIGKAVGVGCHLSELRRTRAGKFAIAAAHTLDQLEEFSDPESALLPPSEAVVHLPSIILDERGLEDVRHGRQITGEAGIAGPVSMLGPEGGLVAVGMADAASGTVQPKIVVV